MSKFISLSLFSSSLKGRQLYSQAPLLYKTASIKLAATTKANARFYSSANNDTEPAVEGTINMEESMNQIEQLYSEAKDEIEYAEDSQGTTYYHEDLATAGKAVDEVFDAYDKFIQSLPTEDMKKEVKQKVDLKMEELKMAFAALPEESD